MPNEAGQPKDPGRRSAMHSLWWALDIVSVRLRFILLMVLVGLVVGYWEDISNHVDRWLRPAKTPSLVAATEVEYYCPMHPNIIRSEPGNCPICGMPLVERAKTDHAELPEGVLAREQLTPLKVQMGSIASTPVEYRLLTREIRTVGIVDYDETRRAFIAARIKGRIDKLFVNFVGQHVEQGDPLVWIYSPELLTAQQELLVAQRGLNGQSAPGALATQMTQSLLDTARQKLLLWSITDEQIDEILRRGTPETHLTIYSPISGFVTEKKVLEGRYVDEGDDLYTIADLSSVWMEAKVFEDESAGVEVCTAVEVRCTAFPAELFAGRITFIAYKVDPATRTVSARVEIANPNIKLKPGMYAQAFIRVPIGRVTEIPPPAATAPAATEPAGTPPIDTSDLARAYLALTAVYTRDEADPAAVAEVVKQARALAAATSNSPAEDARAIADLAAQLAGKDLPAQRNLLKSLSARVIKLLHANPTRQKLYVAHCQMVNADWVQDVETINNPYMGREMPRCGVVTETVAPRTAPAESGDFATGYYCPVTPDRLYDEPALCPIDKFPFKYVRIEKVLAVPVAAVINTGTRKIVYRETSPGTFDMLEVTLAPRAGEFYPVLSGLKAGEQVATRGAFLVDAENRLNPAASAQYFGATAGPQQTPAGDAHQH